MTLQIFPTLPGLTYPVLKSAEFDTLVQSSPNKYETTIPQTINPVWHWEFIYDFLRDFSYGSFTITELRTLLDFFLYQGGQAGTFLYLDPDDNYVGPAMNGESPNTPLAQLQVVTDGNGHYYSPLQRTLGGLFYEDITNLNTNTEAGGSALAVYANGVLQTTGGGSPNYTLSSSPGLAIPGASFMGIYLTWAAEPTQPITAQFNFCFRVRFESDTQDMEKFVNQFWTIGGSESKNGKGYLQLVSRRPQPL
jgi:Conserved hypothetical protein 2217 (DUF2460)